MTGGNDGPCAGAGLVCLSGYCDEDLSVCVCDTHVASWGRFCQYSDKPHGSRRMVDTFTPSSPSHATPEYRALLQSHITATIDAIVDDVFPKNRAKKRPPGGRALKANDGHNYPLFALSMIGREGLHSLAAQVIAAIDGGIPGDLIETGVWKGGASILMSVILHAMGQSRRRRVFVCDSFDGVRAPSFFLHCLFVTISTCTASQLASFSHRQWLQTPHATRPQD